MRNELRILIFPKRQRAEVDKMINEIGGTQELRFTPELTLRPLLQDSVIAVECENSLWKALKMPQYGSSLKPQRRRGGTPGLKKTAVVPTVIIKEEDLAPLLGWEQANGVPIHIWHVFYDAAFGISLAEAKRLIDQGQVEPTVQTFQAPGGATTKKVIYKVYYHYAYPVGTSTTEPTLVADYIEDKNGHILPFVKFHGGRLHLSDKASALLAELEEKRQRK